MKWLVVIPDNVMGDLISWFDDYYAAILFADPLAHVGAKIFEAKITEV